MSPNTYKHIPETLGQLQGPLRDLYEELGAFLMALGDDVQRKTLKFYVAFRRLKNFACVEVYPSKQCIRVHAKIDPDSVELREGFTRDVREVGHFGTGNLEITLASREDLERAKPLLQKIYEVS